MFDMEIERIWKRRVSLVTLLFVVNRYVCLCYTAFSLVDIVAWGNTNADTADRVSNLRYEVCGKLISADSRLV